MTRSGERSALGPDPVSVHQRLRELLARCPEGPLPEAELKAIQESLEPPPAGSVRPSGDVQSRLQARRAASAQLSAILNATDPSVPDGLDALAARLRARESHCPSRIEPSDVHLSAEHASVIASHLLRTGATAIELLAGLDLVVHAQAEVDFAIVREMALLGGSIGFEVSVALMHSARPAHDLHWVLTRDSDPRLHMFASQFGRLAREAVDDLLETLTVSQTIAVVLMAADLRPVPAWLRDHEGLRQLLRAVADDPALLEPGVDGLVALVRLWDEVRYGGCALLGFSREERSSVAERFRTALAGMGALAETERALADRPDDGDRIWLRQRIEDARSERPGFPPGLAIRVAVPPPSTHRDAQLHVVIDGEPVTVSWFERGHSLSPESILDSGRGLRGSPESDDVLLSQADCVEECCGAFRVRIRRDDEAVEWEIRGTGRSDKAPRRFRFPVEVFDTELDRALADRAWEWPARRVARILRSRLEAEPELLGRWDCRRGWIGAGNRERGAVEVAFIYPEGELKRDDPWLLFKHSIEIADAFEVDDVAVEATVDRVVAMLRTTDPKTVAAVCGGSRKHAETLGFPWPG
jgi:hypothetical protein